MIAEWPVQEGSVGVEKINECEEYGSDFPCESTNELSVGVSNGSANANMPYGGKVSWVNNGGISNNEIGY